MHLISEPRPTLGALEPSRASLGTTSFLVTEFICVLEGWFQGWGRKEDANLLHGGMKKLIGNDGVDGWPDKM